MISVMVCSFRSAFPRRGVACDRCLLWLAGDRGLGLVALDLVAELAGVLALLALDGDEQRDVVKLDRVAWLHHAGGAADGRKVAPGDLHRRGVGMVDAQ